MLNFTPPIKASLFISFVYLVCFQLFLHSGNYVWLYPANVLFFVCSFLYVLFLNKSSRSQYNMLLLTVKGTRLTFTSSVITLFGSATILLLNIYLFKGSATSLVAKSATSALTLLFSNAFLVNLVCGSLGAFLTAGLVNERNYEGGSKPLPSVKH